MKSMRAAWLWCAALVLAVSGCSGPGAHLSGNDANTAPVSLLITGEPIVSGISVLSFEVTLTSATLNPGARQLLSAPATVELTRLQTETTLLDTADIAPGTYTDVALTFANPTLTFRNNTAGTITIWGTSCLTGAICHAAPTLPANVDLTGTVVLPGSGVVLALHTPAALLLNLDLSTMLLNTVQADLAGNTLAGPVIPANPGDPFASLQDVVGTVSAKDVGHSTFDLLTSLGFYRVHVVAGTSPTLFRNFPSLTCTPAAFTCLQNGQIVSVNMDLLTDGTLLASDVFFEDADSALPEIEGTVIATSGLTPPVTFQIVVLSETPDVPGISVGEILDVAPKTTIPAATFDIDNIGADTAAYTFTGNANLMVGQQVQVRRLSTSTSSRIDADRIRLRSSRLSASVATVASPFFNVGTLPPLFATGGITQLQVKTDPAFTEFSGTALNLSQIAVNHPVIIRAQLFPNGPTSAAVATKVVQLPLP